MAIKPQFADMQINGVEMTNIGRTGPREGAQEELAKSFAPRDAESKRIQDQNRKNANLDMRNILTNKGQLGKGFTAKGNTEAIGQMRSFASGGSAFKNRMGDMQRENQTNLREEIGNIGAMSQTDVGQAQGNLAQGSGLGSGAAGRIERAGNRNAMMEKQIARAGAEDRSMGIIQQGEQAREGMQQALPGAELQNLSTDEFNLKNNLAERERKSGYATKQYKAKLGQFGADANSEAIRNSQPKQGFFGNILGGLL